MLRRAAACEECREVGDCYIAPRVSLRGINLPSPTCARLREGEGAFAGEKGKAESVGVRLNVK